MERALLDLLASHTSLALAASDADGTLTMMTPALERLLGRATEPMREDDLPGELNLYYEDGRTPLRVEDMPIARARAGEQVIDAVVTARPDDRSDRVLYLRCNGTPLKGDDGRIRGALLLVQDVTEEWLVRAHEAELRERLIVTVNHELRTPVTKLLGHAEVLQEVRGEMPPWAQRSLDAVMRASVELAELSGTITQLVDLEAAGHITPTYCDLAPAVRALVAELSVRGAGRSVALELSAPTNVRATVDLPGVTRSLSELIDNALTYAPPGTRVGIDLRVDGSCVIVSVADQGAGIPERERDRLLQPFERGDRPGQPVNSRGLGLAYARTIAAAHGGDLTLRSNDPTGLVAEWRINRFGERTRTATAMQPAPS